MSRLRGVAANPSATGPLLELLAERDDSMALTLLGRETLPATVVERLAAHPDPQVRRELAGHPSTPGPVLERLARDADPWVRADAASAVGLSEETVMELADDPDAFVRFRVALRRPSQAILRKLLTDPDDEVRRSALSGVSGPLPLRLAEPFFDETGYYREVAIALVELTPELIARFRTEPDALARNPTLPSDLMARLAVGHALALAENPALPDEVLATLVSARDPEVHRELLRRDTLPDHLRRRLLAADEDDEPLPFVPSLDQRHAGLDLRLSYVDHPNPAFRRTVARSTDLPPDAVARLAADEDFPVRLLLCESNPDAPPEVLVEVAETYGGYSRWDMYRHPRLPADAVARAAASEDDTVRHAVASRADLPPDLLARLLADGDIEVRRAAAANPALPLATVRALLDDPDLAEAAASNPALDADELSRIVSGGPS